MRLGILVAALAVSLGCGSSSKQPDAPKTTKTSPPPPPATKAACLSEAELAKATHAVSWARPDGAVVCAVMGKQRKCYHLNQAGAVREHEGTAQSGVGGTVERTQIPNMKVDSTSGKHKAVFDGKTISIIDNATKKVVTTINVSQTIPPKGGVDSEVTAMYFIGDRLFLRDSHAGPHEDIVLYSIDGKLHGTVWNEVYGGSVTIIDAHRIAFGYADMSSFAVYDTRDHKLTEMKRALPETPACTKKIREELNVDVEHMSDCKGSKDPHKQQCCLQLRPVFQYQQASIVPMGNTTIALVPAGKSFAMVGLYDTAKRAVTKHVNLACATVHK